MQGARLLLRRVRDKCSVGRAFFGGQSEGEWRWRVKGGGRGGDEKNCGYCVGSVGGVKKNV